MEELTLSELSAQGRHDEITTRLLRELGPELLGFVRAQVRDHAYADDAYAEFCVDLWRSIPDFRGHCSFRAWAYTLARNAALRVLTRRVRPRGREVSLSQLSQFPELEMIARTTRERYVQSAVQDGFAALRDRLTEEERTLLILRVDKDLAWKDVAAVLSGARDDAELAREAVRRRQQFSALKRKLTHLAREAGLLDGDPQK